MANEPTERKAALICGSVAYDTILVFPDRFQAHLLPDKLHMLNVAFLVPEMRREFGGCAANIAYGLELLGDRAMPWPPPAGTSNPTACAWWRGAFRSITSS